MCYVVDVDLPDIINCLLRNPVDTGNWPKRSLKMVCTEPYCPLDLDDAKMVVTSQKYPNLAVFSYRGRHSDVLW